MPSVADPDVVAVNLEDRLAITDSDDVIQIETMFDGDGEETDDCDAALTAIAQIPDGRWTVIRLWEFTDETVQ